MRWFRERLAQVRRKQRIKAAKSATTPLREFVYLDEVSVQSLLTSRHGAPVAEYTNSSELGLKSEVSGTGGFDIAAVKAEVGTRVEGSRTVTTQVLRKTTTQSAFRELYEGEVDRLATKPPSADSSPPQIKSWTSFVSSAPEAIFDEWLIDPSRLERGQLIEMEVELEAEATYRFSSVITTLLEMIEETPELMGGVDSDNLAQAAGVNRILSRMLAGLIPLKCRLAEYRAIDVGGHTLLVHDRLLQQLRLCHPGLVSEPAYVVGVTEQNLYWRDVRRVLFTGARFRVLCRLNQGGLAARWTPIKLTELLEPFIPDFTSRFEIMSRLSWQADDVHAELAGRVQQTETALTAFGTALAHQYQADWPVTGQQAGDLVDLTTVDFSNIEQRRAAFATIADHLQLKLGLEFDPVQVAQLRTDALLQAGLGLDGRTSAGRHQNIRYLGPTGPEALLDAEFVAIYW